MEENRFEIWEHMSPEEVALYDRFSEMLDELGRVGWMFGGGGPNTTVGIRGNVLIGIALPATVGRLTRSDVVASVPMFDDEGSLLPGWSLEDTEVTEHETYGEVVIGYEGPVDDVFEQVVSALVEFVERRPPAA